MERNAVVQHATDLCRVGIEDMVDAGLYATSPRSRRCVMRS